MSCPQCGRRSAAHIHTTPPAPRVVRSAYPRFMFLYGAGLGFLAGVILSFVGR